MTLEFSIQGTLVSTPVGRRLFGVLVFWELAASL